MAVETIAALLLVAAPTSSTTAVLAPLSQIKLTAYVQGRFELHQDSAAVGLEDGRPGVTTQFLVRRGRLKAAYTAAPAELLIELDASSSGVGLKDAEATFIEPWTGTGLRFTVGQFKTPFGYDIGLSSSVREMPERARVTRKLFPGERDRGFRFRASAGVLRLVAAAVNGNGVADPIYGAHDSNVFKDLTGRIGADFDWLAFGISGYFGRAVLPGSEPDSHVELDKIRAGADAQVRIDLPPGELALRAEVVFGEELGREVLGWWAFARQNFTDELGVFVRLDGYDPDLALAGGSVTTLGGGIQYFLSEHLRATAAYEHPMGPAATDEADDALILQLQAMF